MHVRPDRDRSARRLVSVKTSDFSDENLIICLKSEQNFTLRFFFISVDKNSLGGIHSEAISKLLLLNLDLIVYRSAETELQMRHTAIFLCISMAAHSSHILLYTGMCCQKYTDIW